MTPPFPPPDSADGRPVSWFMISDHVVEELRQARRNREERGDSPNAGDVQRAHLRFQKALEALGDAVLHRG